MNELLPAPAKLSRVWDKDWNLVHLFRADENYEQGLSLDHPVAKFLTDNTPNPAYLTVDEDGTRWAGALYTFLVERVDGATRMQVHWHQIF